MRADLYLVREGVAQSRETARRSIEAGLVVLDGKPVKKPSEPVDETEPHEIVFSDPLRYVSRGGLKLEGALNAFSMDVRGLSCVDIGASTGGFTDCLLQRGAARVCAVDSGHGQLAAKLCADPRVVSLEGKNARDLLPEDLPFVPQLAVMDVSFISQTLILPRIAALLPPDGLAVTLIKPQFEAGKAALGKGGIVRSADDRRFAVRRVLAAASECGLYARRLCDSPIEGGDGNREYLVLLSRQPGVLPPRDLSSLHF